jgi:hypothetical protein
MDDANYPPDRMDEPGSDPSSIPPKVLDSILAALARDAAKILRDHPLAAIVGIVAEGGTIECRRVRTLIEPGTDAELEAKTFAGVVPASSLTKILDHTFPPEAIAWIMEHEAGGKLQILVCTQDAVRVATVVIPGAPGHHKSAD